MKTTAIRLYTLNYGEAKTYLVASAFIAGNLILPRLFHSIPQGGPIFLPIYFFTLIAAYKYGWKAGLLTAVFSPLINSALFGMPAFAMLPVILLKSVLLAFFAGFAAKRFGRISIPVLAGVVLAYQLAGTLGEWLLTGSFHTAVQDFRIAAPGMLLQVFGGFFFIRYLIRK